MKTLFEILLFIILWPIVKFWRLLCSLFVRFVYKKDQIFLYNGCFDLTLYRVAHVPLFGSPSFDIIHLHTYNDDDNFVLDDIKYGWSLKFENYYHINRYLHKIPFTEYELIEKFIIETENQINCILREFYIDGKCPTDFMPGMTLFDKKNNIYHIYEPDEESNSWVAGYILLNESLPLLENKFCHCFEDDDKSNYVVIPEFVFEQIITIGKERHKILQNQLLSIKAQYNAEAQTGRFDLRIIYPWGIY